MILVVRRSSSGLEVFNFFGPPSTTHRVSLNFRKALLGLFNPSEAIDPCKLYET